MLQNLDGYTFNSEVPPEHFAHMVDWLLHWRKRNAELDFSLVLIDFKNPSELGNALGAKRAMDLVKRVGSEIENALRTTDLLTRTRVSCFWVLLPKGLPDIVLKKLEPILSAAQQDGMDASQLVIRKLVVPTDLAGNDATALDLFKRMLMIER
jgi:hypothetical protein